MDADNSPGCSSGEPDDDQSLVAVPTVEATTTGQGFNT